jgi:hemerythrin-like domain-containing protein
MTRLPPTFVSLLDTHKALDELFLQHQEALLAQDFPLARERLAAYERELRLHMRLEEEQLFPIYQRGEPVPGGAVELFAAEHRKMLDLLSRFRDELAQLEQGTGDRKRGIIRLLDHEAVYKHLAEHHDLRERNILYPTLDQVATEGERRELLRQ